MTLKSPTGEEPPDVETSLAVQLGGHQNKAWAEDKTTFGHKMLLKMGWKEGKGAWFALGSSHHAPLVSQKACAVIV